MRGVRVEAMEERLHAALERVDAELERRHGDRYDLHPARQPHGTAARRQYDGLFEVTAGFSAGYGSTHGPGYAVNLRIVTLEHVPPEARAAFEAEAVGLLEAELKAAFPARELEIVRDVHGLKIVGDLKLT
jgi:hypothetical protein